RHRQRRLRPHWRTLARPAAAGVFETASLTTDFERGEEPQGKRRTAAASSVASTMDLERFTRDYSLRLGVLTGQQLQAALARFELDGLVDAQPAQGGIFGQNVFLSSTKGEYVLRGKPHYDWQLPAERFFAKLIHERSKVPAPWPYLIEDSPDIFGWAFAIMPRLPGVSLTDAFRPEDSLSE